MKLKQCEWKDCKVEFIQKKHNHKFCTPMDAGEGCGYENSLERQVEYNRKLREKRAESPPVERKEGHHFNSEVCASGYV